MIYVSSACLKDMYIRHILKKYMEQGFINVELSGGTKYYEDIYKDLERYKQNYHMQFACHAYFPPPKEDFVVNLASCNDKIYNCSIEHYINCIQFIRKLDCHTLSVHSGFYVEVLPCQIGREIDSEIIYNHNEALERMCSAYEKLKKECKKYDINLYLENNVLNTDNYSRYGNINQFMMTDFDSYQELASQMEFNLLLDIGHLYVSSHTLNRNFNKECIQFSKNCKWLHISENNGLIDQHKPLIWNSDIVRAYNNYFDKDIPVTLETTGSIDEILNSYIILTKMHEKSSRGGSSNGFEL